MFLIFRGQFLTGGKRISHPLRIDYNWPKNKYNTILKKFLPDTVLHNKPRDILDSRSVEEQTESTTCCPEENNSKTTNSGETITGRGFSR